MNRHTKKTNTLREWQQMPETPNLDAQLSGPQYMGPATFMKVSALTEPRELDLPAWRAFRSSGGADGQLPAALLAP
jgi:hypothetical protein